MSEEYSVTHNLKINPEYFERIWSEQKRFEIRKDDRNYQVGDQLILECDIRKISLKVIYKTTFQQKEGYCVLGFTIGDKNE